MRSLLDEFQFECKSDEECQSLKIRRDSEEFLQIFKSKYLDLLKRVLDSGTLEVERKDTEFFIYKVNNLVEI